MQNSSRNLKASWLLGFLLLVVGACRGMRLPRESKPSWEECKDASQEILSELWKLGLEEMQVVEANVKVQLPQRIECGDKCDPDSLDNNKTGCLEKIHKQLHHYHKLLVQLFPPESKTELKNTLYKLLQLISKLGGNMESSSQELPSIMREWEKETLQGPILLRLQSFAVVVARVISHCAALARNEN